MPSPLVSTMTHCHRVQKTVHPETNEQFPTIHLDLVHPHQFSSANQPEEVIVCSTRWPAVISKEDPIL